MILPIIHLLLALTGVVIVVLYKKKEKKDKAWEMIFYTSLGLSIYGILASIYTAIEMPQFIFILLAILLAAVMGIASTLFALKRIQFPEYFAVKNVEKINLEQGKISIILEMKPTNSINFYIKELKAGKEGLFISRANKDIIKQGYPDMTGTTLWLSAEHGSDINPTDLEEVSYIINDFISKHKDKSVILVDGFTFLANYHDFMKVMHLFQILKDKVSKENCIAIMPIEEKTLEAEQAKMIKAEFVVI